MEIASFFILLVFAGMETSRNAISHGVLALTRHPEQRALVERFRRGEQMAVEEIMRWASPVVYMRRTLTEERAAGRHGDGRRRQGHHVVYVGEP
ncbi:cytochrome P450 [Mycobacterium sp. URHB0021]